jgi:hypothetical protein
MGAIYGVMKLSPELLALIDPLLDALAERLAQRQAPRDDAFVNARSSGIPVRAFRRAARAGEFPVFRVGREWLARRADVAAYVERQQVRFDAASASGDDAFERAVATGRLRAVGRR